MSKSFFLSVAMLLTAAAAAGDDYSRLEGVVMGTAPNSGYSLEAAFDGDLATNFYAFRTDGYYRPWAGLDLGANHVIKRIGFAPDASSKSCSRLAIFQGASTPDFADAMPIAMVPTEGPVAGRMYYIDVNVSRGFRYVRMVGGGGAQLNIAELEFYGIPGDGDDSQFFQVSNLPTIAFNTPGMAQIMSKDDKHPGSVVHVISDNGTSLFTDAEAQMKGRGNASWQMDKKPFQIKFNKKQRILPDAPAKAKKWTLINNHGDKTLMRNRIAFDMSRIIGMRYTPYCTFVDVIYNGEYQGCYQLCDQIEVNPGRIEITEMEPDDAEGDALTGGYLLEVDGYADREQSWFQTPYGIPVTIKSPDEDDITPAQSKYIEQYFNDFLNAVYSYDYTDPQTGYRRYLDLDSWLRYFICGELNGNTDTYWSTYMTKERGDDRLYTGPIWDIDLGFNNDNRTFDINNRDGFLFQRGSSAGNWATAVTRTILQDPETRHQLSVIWSTLRKRPDFNADYFCTLIDGYAAQIDDSQRYNFVRWPILDKWIHMNPRLYYTFEAECKAVKDYIRRRFDRLDKTIGIVDGPDSDAVETVLDHSADIYVRQGEIVAKGNAGECVDLYSAQGIHLSRYTLTGGVDILPTGSLHGIVIVKTSVKSYRFML